MEVVLALGLLVAGASPAQLSEAMGRLLCDPALGQKMGRCACEFAVANYGVEAMVVRYIEAYERAVADTAGKGRREPA